MTEKHIARTDGSFSTAKLRKHDGMVGGGVREGCKCVSSANFSLLVAVVLAPLGGCVFQLKTELKKYTFSCRFQIDFSFTLVFRNRELGKNGELACHAW